MIGKCKVILKNMAGGEHITTIYVVDGEEEPLLGKEDAVALGIIRLDRIGMKMAVIGEETKHVL